MNPRRTALALLLVLLAPPAGGQPSRRALLIGIDDYTASTLPEAKPGRERGWPDLKGAANDVRILAGMLVPVYGFEKENIVTLTNQQATRAAILEAIEHHLVRPARRGDVVFFYFAGHGAQVPNGASDEPDRLDESIVPADSRRGAEDIRDKELRPLFNRVLDRGAQLTLLLDHCHSGGAFRGVPGGARPRGIAPAPPIVDPGDYGPRPEERGALVLVSTQDLDTAWEDQGEDGLWHGAFTWAWIRAMRDAVSGEPAYETFLRAQARLRGERADQSPAMLAGAEARLRPFLGTRVDRRNGRAVVAVERVEADGRVVLQGGWANGLAVHSELTPTGDRTTRLRVTTMLGLGRSIARVISPHASSAAIRSGALLEVVGWAAPPGRPLRIWAPSGAHVDAVDGIVRVDDARYADYLLTQRFDGPRREHAWTRPRARSDDRHNSGLPQHSAWTSDPARLRRDLETLRRIHAWYSLEPPVEAVAPYRLAVRREQTRELVSDGVVFGGGIYSIVLRARQPLPADTPKRYYYVFVVDGHGNSFLVFPKSGSVENRFPIADPAPSVIPLGEAGAFRITRPYGSDTYVLLSTEEPLPNPSILEWDGVRAGRALPATQWTIERVVFESVEPARREKRR